MMFKFDTFSNLLSEKQKSLKKLMPFIAPIFVLIYGFLMAYPRFAYGDEVLYLLETGLIADCIRNLKWFGNELVGTHGFIFKLPVAFLFVIFGNSIFIATAFNILLASISAYLCYILFYKVTNSTIWSLAGSFMLVTSFYFVLTVPTFLRDIPALLVLLLFILAILEKKNPLIIGLLLLLLLDAKEYLFFIASPVYFICSAVIHFSQNNKIISRILQFTKNIIIAYMPSVIFIIIMLISPLIPLNQYIVYLLGLSRSSHQTITEAFLTETATYNLHRKGKSIVSFLDKKDKSKTSRKKEWRVDDLKKKIGYVDENAQNALSILTKKISEKKKILLIYYRIKPELLSICPETRLMTYYGSEDFPEKMFRNATTAKDKMQIFDNLGIEGVLVEPEMAGSKYYLASGLPKLLQEEIFFEKVYDKNGIKCYTRTNEYQKLFEICAFKDKRILLIDDNLTYKEYVGANDVISFFDKEFPLSDFLKSKNAEDANLILDKLGIGYIILNTDLKSNDSFAHSFLSNLLADKNLYSEIKTSYPYIIFASSNISDKTLELIKKIDKSSIKVKDGIPNKYQYSDTEKSPLLDTVESLDDLTSSSGKILLVDYSLPSDIEFSPTRGRLISYFNSDFPEAEFRLISKPERALLFLLSHNIEAIVLQSRLEDHFLIKASKLPELLANSQYFNKISLSENKYELSLQCFLINDPYREIFKQCEKELEQSEKILIIDDKQDFSKYDLSSRIILIDSKDFSSDVFSQIEDFHQAFSYLKERNIRRLILNAESKSMISLNKSQLPDIMQNKIYSCKLPSIGPLEIYDLRYEPDDIISNLLKDKNPMIKTLFVGHTRYLTRSKSKIIDLYSNSFPMEKFCKYSKDVYKAIYLLRSMNIDFILIDWQKINEKDLGNTPLPFMLKEKYSECLSNDNEKVKLYRIKNNDEITSMIDKNFIELDTIKAIRDSSKNERDKKNILFICEKFDPDIQFFTEGHSIISFIDPDIASQRFHKTIRTENISKLIDVLNCGYIVVFPGYENNTYFNRCKYPEIIADPLLAQKIYNDTKNGITAYKLENPYNKLLEITEKNIIPTKKILFIDENLPAIKSRFKNYLTLFYFDSSFPAKEFCEIKNLNEAAYFLISKDIQLIIINKLLDGKELFKNSLFKSLIGSPKYMSKLLDTKNFCIYKFLPNIFDEYEKTLSLAKTADSGAQENNVLRRYCISVKDGHPNEGKFLPGEKVEIFASKAPVRKIFARWEVAPLDAIKYLENAKSPNTILTMPAHDVNLEAVFVDSPKYKLVVSSGEGSGEYKAGETINIKALPPPEKEFDSWITNPAEYSKLILDAKSSETTVEMPARKLQVIPLFKNKLFRVSVIKGKGSGAYPAGAMLEISASIPPENMKFSHWIFDIPDLQIEPDEKSPSIKITMPKCDLTIEAVFKEKPAPRILKVVDGSGSGKYIPGTKVEISPNNKGDKWVFVGWESNIDIGLKKQPGYEGRKITLEMPNTDIEIRATYRKAPFGQFVLKKASKLAKYFMAYFGKICYPRTFSFLSVALIVVIPSLVMAVSFIPKWIKENNFSLFLILFYIFFVLIYLLRASHARYLIHLSPVIYLFFILLLRKTIFNGKKTMVIALVISIPFVIAGLFFEVTYVTIKIVGTALLFFLLLLTVLNFKKSSLNKFPKASAMLFIIVYCFLTFASSLVAFYQIGQAGKYAKFGYNFEWNKIAKEFPQDEKLWLNINPKMVSFYTGNIAVDNRYKLNPSFPKDSMLIRRQFYYFNFSLPWREFKDALNQLNITALGIIVPDEKTGVKYPNTNMLETLMSDDDLWHEKTVKLKNKTLYVFRVI